MPGVEQRKSPQVAAIRRAVPGIGAWHAIVKAVKDVRGVCRKEGSLELWACKPITCR